jgi:RNA-binding protein
LERAIGSYHAPAAKTIIGGAGEDKLGMNARPTLPRIHIAPVDRKAMPDLSPSDRRNLKARAHHLEPVVMVGGGGLTPQVLGEVETNLRSHELIKIRVLGEDRASRRDLITAICAATGASPVQQIGRILVIYRPKPPESEPKAAPRPRKPPRKTKRAYRNA